LRPFLDKVKDNLLNGLDYETVMEFQYLFQCYYESLRIEPPIAQSSLQTFSQDVTIGVGGKQVLIKKNTLVNISFEAIHYDPITWREPYRF
jgi:cytochrome P450